MGTGESHRLQTCGELTLPPGAAVLLHFSRPSSKGFHVLSEL